MIALKESILSDIENNLTTGNDIINDIEIEQKT